MEDESLGAMNSSREPWLYVAYAAIPFVLSMNGYSYLFEKPGVNYFNLLLAFSLAAIVVWGLYLFLGAPGQTPVKTSIFKYHLTRWLPSLVTVVYLSTYLHLVAGSPLYANQSALLVGLGMVSSVVATRSKRVLRALPWILVTVALANLLVLMPRMPLGSNGDMFLKIMRGVDRMLGGLAPYVDTRVVDAGHLDYSYPPLTYFPAMWLSYLPWRAAGLDLRYLSLLSFWLACLILIVVGRRNPYLSDSELATVAAVVSCSPVMWMKLPALQTPVWWALLLLFCLGIVKRWHPAALGMLLGVISMTRESVIVLVPVMLVFVFQHFGSIGLYTFAASAAVVAVGIAAPFVLLDPQAFYSSVTYNALYNTFDGVARQVPLGHVGLGGWLYWQELSVVAMSLQCATIAVVCYQLSRRIAEAHHLFFAMGATYFSFMFFHAIVFEYYYIPAMFLIGLGLLTNGSLSRRV